ncbi:MAG: TIR domain-containing protein [Candidatus Lokiarchaeota archaeon]|nr:TIR domain-containing protein [Candidatus Lokiarchaeota archaeon]
MVQTILIIDDDITWIKRFTRYLESYRYAIESANTTDCAKDILEDFKINLILLDLCLYGDKITPEDELFWEYLHSKFPKLPVIASSAWQLDVEEAWRLWQNDLYGFVDFIDKNKLNLNSFRQRVESVLNAKQITKENESEIHYPKKMNKTPYYYDIFISYSHKNQDWVYTHLLKRLEREDFRICIDFRDFRIGAPLIKEMERAIIQSKKILLIFSPEYLSGEWTEFECVISQAIDPAARERRILPIMYRYCDLPLRISNLIYLDFTDQNNLEHQLNRLIATLKE